MDQDKLIAAIDAYAESAHGSDHDGGELSNQRSLALRAYSGENLEPAPDGRSQVVDRSIFETVQWIMPSLMRIFGGGDSGNIVEFDPQGREDEEPAEQESLVLNHMITSKNDWELVARTWMQDALITKNAYCLVTMEEKKKTEIERYEGQREEQLTMLIDDDVEVVGQNQYDDPEDDGEVIDPFTGQPVQDEATLMGALATYEEMGMQPEIQYRQLYDVELKRIKTKKELALKVLAPELCKVGKDTDNFTLNNCNYFEYAPEVTLSELRALGYEIDDDIASDSEYDTEEEDARDGELATYDGFETPDKSMRRIVARYIWIRHDADEDGIAELQFVLRVGNEIIEHMPVSTIPVASIVPFMNTHRHVGNSVADLIFDVQRIKTKLLRSGLDSTDLSIHNRHAVSNKVNLNDLLKAPPGGVVRLKDGAIPGEGHIMPLTSEFVLPQALTAIDHMNQVIESRVGVNRMFQGLDTSNVNDHNRIGQLSTMAAQRVEDIARIFGEGYKRLFAICHELMIKSGHSGQTMKIRGEWVDIDPEAWSTGRDMRVTAPFAAGNKDSLVNRLMLHLQIHEKALMSGAPFVDQQDAYNLLTMLADATDVAGSKIYTDPSSLPPPEPPPPDPTMIALEIEKAKAEGEIADEARQDETNRYKIDKDAELKEYTARLNSETQIAVAQLRAELDAAKIGVQVESRGQVKPKDDGKMKALEDKIAGLEKEVSKRARKIIRDDKDRIVGIE